VTAAKFRIELPIVGFRYLITRASWHADTFRDTVHLVTVIERSKFHLTWSI
jgi:hypothetical protein